MEFHPKSAANFLAIRKDLYASAPGGRLYRTRIPSASGVTSSSLATLGSLSSSGNVTYQSQHETRFHLLVSDKFFVNLKTKTNRSYLTNVRYKWTELALINDLLLRVFPEILLALTFYSWCSQFYSGIEVIGVLLPILRLDVSKLTSLAIICRPSSSLSWNR